eukprot:Protomagalhaensia_wolfi_Nauph_80__2683@NODE_2810_length_979_cov_272_471277_g1310_i1_p1_GENE_NODE_2810_length_979_cov_272_471277_g1310_i1NODE_2810_length_979_cov_272_471277_g1310_i1_p1_ORF_typecomplete_len209_score27_35_NODE_2810_length_979_cov_272_471277_g1310_i116642
MPWWTTRRVRLLLRHNRITIPSADRVKVHHLKKVHTKDKAVSLGFTLHENGDMHQVLIIDRNSKKWNIASGIGSDKFLVASGSSRQEAFDAFRGPDNVDGPDRRAHFLSTFFSKLVEAKDLKYVAWEGPPRTLSQLVFQCFPLSDRALNPAWDYQAGTLEAQVQPLEDTLSRDLLNECPPADDASDSQPLVDPTDTAAWTSKLVNLFQ